MGRRWEIDGEGLNDAALLGCGPLMEPSLAALASQGACISLAGEDFSGARPCRQRGAPEPLRYRFVRSTVDSVRTTSA
jgi:hypothetical protein